MDIDKAKKLYKQMLLIRRFEEKCVELYSNQNIRGFMHLYNGEEAVAVGIMDPLLKEDSVIATYREHGQALSKGVSANSIMAEMFGKEQGCSMGRGGSMHLFDKDTNFYGGNAIVAGGLPLAVGMAMANKMQGNSSVTVCIFGDGAVAEGEFHESLNLAALWKLPILFVCENNKYGMGTALELSESQTDISKKAQSYNIEAMQIDGMDITEVSNASHYAVDKIRTTGLPVFIEALTYRFRAHSMFDAELYRSKEEVSSWKKKDPLLIFEKELKQKNLWDMMEIEKMEIEISKTIEEAVEFAQNGTFEPVENLEKFVYSLNEVEA